MTCQHVYDHFVKQLTTLYDKQEAESITRLLFRELLGMTPVNMVTESQRHISEVKANNLAYCLVRLMKGEPVQYVLGYTWFYGLKVRVNRHVLIPRPETEELVDWIIRDHRNQPPMQMLDVGTGSGCIAIALKKNLPHASVAAVDVSMHALDIAKENSKWNETEIAFGRFDLLNQDQESLNSLMDARLHADSDHPIIDLIVSNPPYIPQSEIQEMHPNVKDYEPHLALFVPDRDPMIYYKAIAEMAEQYLSSNGVIYLELHENYTHLAVEILNSFGYSSIQVINDLQGKQRMLRAGR